MQTSSHPCPAPQGESEQPVLAGLASFSEVQIRNGMSMKASVYVVDEANEKLLALWLIAGRWTRSEAALLFLDIDPDYDYGETFSTFSGHGEVQYDYFDDERKFRVPCGEDEEGELEYLTAEQDALLRKKKVSVKQIERSLSLHDSAEPHEWIELALKKEIHIPWLGWAIESGLYGQKAEPGAVSTAPVVGGSEDAPIQWHLLATPAELIAAFGSFTGMNKAWFNDLKYKPQLKDARGIVGVSGRGGTAPFFYVFPVMQWLISPARRTGRPLGADKGWQLFESHFPRAYAEFSVGDPRTD
jgi:hypothetical protein